MRKLIPAIAMLAIVTAGCASGAASTGVVASPTPSQGARNGASGEVVKVGPGSLVLSAQSGDQMVMYTSATRITNTRTATLLDITAGQCILATGQKDASGTLTAVGVRLSNKVGGSCVTGQSSAGTRAPAATSPPQSPTVARANGEVISVSGTAVGIRDTQGQSLTIVVPTTIPVTASLAATPSDITIGQCAFAAGQRTSTGTVSATSLTLSPPGPNGCTPRGAGGFGTRRGGTGGAPPA